MKSIEHVTDIDAAPDAVWRVLTDVDAYESWNPFMRIEPAPTRVGQRLTVTVRPGRRRMTFRPTVTEHDPCRTISWLGHFLVRGLVDGAHTLRLEPLPDGRTRFVQRETFRGLLVPFTGSMLRATKAGFAAMDDALRARVESEAPAPAS